MVRSKDGPWYLAAEVDAYVSELEAERFPGHEGCSLKIREVESERDNIRYQLQTLLHAYRTGNSISPFREAEMRETASLPK